MNTLERLHKALIHLSIASPGMPESEGKKTLNEIRLDLALLIASLEKDEEN